MCVYCCSCDWVGVFAYNIAWAIRDFVNGEFHALAYLHDLLGFRIVFRHWKNFMM